MTAHARINDLMDKIERAAERGHWSDHRELVGKLNLVERECGDIDVTGEFYDRTYGD